VPTLSTPTTRFSGSVAPQRSRDTYLKHIYLLDVRIDEINKTTALEKAAEFLQGTKSKKIFTPNPEMLVKAHADLYFKKVLNGGDLNLCDGMGLVIASGFKLKRIPGVDFMLELCALAEKNNKSIFLLGSRKEEVLTNTATKLLQRFPKLKIAGYCNGPEVAENNITMKQYNNATVVITANLPYLTRKQFQDEPSIKREPYSALVAEENGLALYRELLEQITTKLLPVYKESLTLYFEIDPSQNSAIFELLQKYLPSAHNELRKDFGGHDRLVISTLPTRS
jgi:hypothetical protein